MRCIFSTVGEIEEDYCILLAFVIFSLQWDADVGQGNRSTREKSMYHIIPMKILKYSTTSITKKVFSFLTFEVADDNN
jgi:hypothetical protein